MNLAKNRTVWGVKIANNCDQDCNWSGASCSHVLDTESGFSSHLLSPFLDASSGSSL